MSHRVAILGGGVAGMSAAQELIERGFEVVVLEAKDIPGGKARSIPVEEELGRSGHALADTEVASIEHHLPGEHGFRFFPGFYKHVIDSMRRIPSFDDRKVADHLVPTTRVGITQYGRPMFEIPAAFPRSPSDAATVLRDMPVAFSPVTDLTPEDLAYFGGRVWQIMTSCAERRLDEYEKIGWWDFVGAETRSREYQKLLAAGITRSLVAAKACTASTRTIGDVFVQVILTIVNPLDGSTDRVLDGRTNLEAGRLSGAIRMRVVPRGHLSQPNDSPIPQPPSRSGFLGSGSSGTVPPPELPEAARAHMIAAAAIATPSTTVRCGLKRAISIDVTSSAIRPGLGTPKATPVAGGRPDTIESLTKRGLRSVTRAPLSAVTRTDAGRSRSMTASGLPVAGCHVLHPESVTAATAIE